MKQKLLYLFVIFAIVTGALFQPNQVEAQTTKVYWDGILMVPGQVGKIKVIKPINLWKRTSKGLVFERVLKPGEQYRVYRYDDLYGGQYGLGGNMYITKMAGYVEYKTPSKAKLQELANAQGSNPGGNNSSQLFPTESTPGLTIGKVLSQSITQIAPGVRKKVIDIDSTNGPQKLFTIDYDGKTANIEMKTELAKDQIIGLETTSSQANSVPQNDSYHVVGGVNADYFDKQGQPIDLMMIGGSIVSTPQTALNELAVLGITTNGKAIIGAPQVSMNLSVNGQQSYAINSVNRKRSANHLVLYTRDFAPTTNTNDLGTEVRVKVESGKLNGAETLIGTVVDNVTGVGNATLNRDEIVLSGHNFASQFLQTVQVGDKIEIKTSFAPAEWNDVKEAVSGRYHLVKNGTIQTINVAGVAPRTAVGVRKDGSLFTAVIDGRTSVSKGLTLQNTAKLMKDLGANYAMTFDGGGSSTLVTRELGNNKVSVVNRPSDGYERSVSNTLLFVSKYKTGALYTIAPSSNVLELFQGATYSNVSVPVKGIDQYMNPVAVSGNGKVTSSVLVSSGGKQVVSAEPGTYAGVVTYDGKTTNLKIKVTNTLDSIVPSESYLQVQKGQTIQLSAKGMKNGQAVLTDASAFSWSTNAGTIQPNGKFTAQNKDGIGTINVKYGSKSIIIPVIVGDVAPTILESFNKGILNYEASGDRVNSVSVQEAKNDRDGTKAIKLVYDFMNTTGTSGAYVNAKTSLTISVPPKKIGMWVKGDGKGNWLRSQVTDSTGKIIQLDFSKNVDWTDWRFVETVVPTGLSYPLKMDLPVRYMQTENAKKSNGEIIIDDIQAIYKD
ncbi:phosphodiester glycosidase family protein [Psychrobacillus vulpis]|uniref:Phosphodiester glycosidase family protein n=1 Tax=Psychrobacillus vulpis TaxID=2325572 RepID=A0A544TV81_9BACI|nr:phosphodiester glycosidase family protein [Psychrobacillus vulpis]TQR21352.1 phosphodiester glycosidase family protein [Psychrobacillus vulpis]